ncbi:TIM21-domain-containing protein [Ascodesmis nigricans]|uniref:Mitochondrial import inner membrane translocase subunit Tim21 n=1 Tax=Ascodesmis nigricans TaxID=341454 RepID=A0A4S2MUZ5_9PEZI|nr:TIM21-domain-containing protein [Ascodesmis nigricans]
MSPTTITPARCRLISNSLRTIPKPVLRTPLYLSSQHFHISHRRSSTASPIPPRNKISVRSGDPSTAKWSQLSKGQKVVRATSTGVSGTVIVAGCVVTMAIAYFLYLEVLAPDSVTNWFNRAHERVKSDPRCLELLGHGRIKAYGEPTDNKWARNRPIAHNSYFDPRGNNHLKIHFNVQGPLAHGVVHIHLVKRPGETEHEYRYLYLDVPGKQRVYLENADESGGAVGRKKSFLGVNWSW